MSALLSQTYDPEAPLIINSNNAINVEKSTIWKLNLIIVPISVIVILLLFIVRDTSIFVASGICESLNLTYSEYGIGASLFTTSYALFLGPVSVVLGKMKISRATALVTFTTGLSSIMLAIVQNKYQFYLARFAMGMFEAGIVPILFNYTGLIYPKKYNLYVYSILSAAMQFAKPIGAILASIFLISRDKWIFGLNTWQFLFLTQGIFGWLFFFAPLLLLPENASDFKLLTPDEKDWLMEETQSQNGIIKEKCNIKSSLYRIIINPKFWIISLTEGTKTICLIGLLSFITLIVSDMLGDNASSDSEVVDSENCAGSSNSALASILSSIPYIFTGIGCILIGNYGKYVKNLSLFLCYTQLISSVFIILWIFVQDYALVAMIILTLANILGGATLSFNVKLLEFAIDEKDRLLAISLFTTIFLIGATLGPIFVGIAVDFYGFNGGMCVMIIALWISSYLISLNT